MKIEYKRIFILFCVLAAMILSATAFCCRNLIYIAALQFFEDDLKLEKTDVSVEWISLEELKQDSKFTFDQSLMLINEDYKIPEETYFNIDEYKDSGVLMNECALESYSEFSVAVFNETGERLLVMSHFRTKEDQAEIYEESPSLAAVPGSSEHEAGLCLDLYVQYNAGDNFIKTAGGKFVNTNCHEYGFIIRYPFYGKKSTGIRYEPWHIRYVGKIHAKLIYSNMMTLEEYISSLKPNTVYSVENYCIVRSEYKNGCVLVPLNFSEYVVSFDNTGHYIITCWNN